MNNVLTPDTTRINSQSVPALASAADVSDSSCSLFLTPLIQYQKLDSGLSANTGNLVTDALPAPATVWVISQVWNQTQCLHAFMQMQNANCNSCKKVSLVGENHTSNCAHAADNNAGHGCISQYTGQHNTY